MDFSEKAGEALFLVHDVGRVKETLRMTNSLLNINHVSNIINQIIISANFHLFIKGLKCTFPLLHVCNISYKLV